MSSIGPNQSSMGNHLVDPQDFCAIGDAISVLSFSSYDLGLMNSNSFQNNSSTLVIDKGAAPPEMTAPSIPLPRTTNLNSQELDVAFAWWYSWVKTRAENTHPFQTDELLVKDFKEVKKFLLASTKKYFSNSSGDKQNFLKISCTPSPLAELQDILHRIVKAKARWQTMRSVIGEVCVYMMVKSAANMVYLSRPICAWGLHQVYCLYSQEVKYLFTSEGIEFPQSWDIRLIKQQLPPPYLPKFFRQKLQLLSKQASRSIGQLPRVGPIHVDLPRLEHVTKKRSFIDMEENLQSSTSTGGISTGIDRSSNGFMSNISPSTLFLENPLPIFAENREERIDEDMPVSLEESHIAFAWWVSWLWSETDSVESLLVNSPEHLRWLCSSRKLSLQDVGIYKNLVKMLLLYNKKFFTNKDKSFNPLTVSFLHSPQNDFKKLLIPKNATQSVDQLIQDVFLYITRDLGLVQNGCKASYFDKNIRAWGLHQLFLLNNVAIRALFLEHNIHFCRPWKLVQTPPLQPLFWSQLTDVQPIHTKNIEACCKDKSGTLLKTNNQFIEKLVNAAKKNMLFIHNEVFLAATNDQCTNNPTAIDWEGQSDVAFACPKQVNFSGLENATKKGSFADMMQDFDLELDPWIAGGFLESDLKDSSGKDFEGWQDLDLDNEESDFEDILNFLDES